ncbi:hypothetical protein IFM89_010618 [Coptis chinensis]|uniref:Uncharacterized protein n=1 Tax=Coptis chinensis TaxID=261450 RepID=A0A835M877_9MAGN|nr:hypothetical protein IFM89_010618 [Coptis chinensis]
MVNDFFFSMSTLATSTGSGAINAETKGSFTLCKEAIEIVKPTEAVPCDFKAIKEVIVRNLGQELSDM